MGYSCYFYIINKENIPVEKKMFSPIFKNVVVH